MTSIFRFLGFSIVSLAFAGTAIAEDAAGRLNETWKDILAGQENVLTPQQFAKLNNLAFQAAAVRVCNDLDLDETKFTEQLAEATSPSATDLTEDEAKAHASFVLVEFGIRVGAFIAEGNTGEKAFCDSALELKGKSDIPNVWQ